MNPEPKNDEKNEGELSIWSLLGVGTIIAVVFVLIVVCVFGPRLPSLGGGL